MLRRGVLRFVGALVVPALLVLGVFTAAFLVLTIVAVPFASDDASRTTSLIARRSKSGRWASSLRPVAHYSPPSPQSSISISKGANA